MQKAGSSSGSAAGGLPIRRTLESRAARASAGQAGCQPAAGYQPAPQKPRPTFIPSLCARAHGKQVRNLPHKALCYPEVAVWVPMITREEALDLFRSDDLI